MPNPSTAGSQVEQPSALQVIAGDAERIAAGLIPEVNRLPQVVGALIKQVEKLAGGQLVPLADEALGIAAELEPGAPAPGASQEAVAALQQQLAEQAAVIKELQLQAQGKPNTSSAAAASPAGAGSTQGESSETA
jgi:hypothetical protein